MLGKLTGGALLLALLVWSPAAAPMDWLSPHLESKRHDNVRKRQQQQHQRNRQLQQTKQQTAPGRQITMAERQAAWSRHKSEYRRKLLSEGQTGADRWLDQQILAGR